MFNATIENILENNQVFDVKSLMAYLHTLTDPRKKRGRRYSMVDLLTLLILAKLGGEDTMKGISEWVKLRGKGLIKLLGLTRTTLPHQTTYERLLDRMDIDEFECAIGQFFAQHSDQNVTITLDGKVLRGTIPEGETQGTHLLAAYVPENGVVLMQMEVDKKTNEHKVAPKLLKAIDLEKCVVTGDAMFTHNDLCQQIVEAKGDYVFPIKGNQSKSQQVIAEVFTPIPVTSGHSQHKLPETYAETISMGHGRIEQRYLTLSTQLNDYLDWSHLGQVFRLQRVIQRLKTGKLTYQVVFGITSLSPEKCTPKRLLEIIRQHWHIENRLHYVRDVTFHEDACQIRQSKRQRFLAAINNLAIGLIRSCDFDYAPEARRHFSVHYDEAYDLLVS